MCATCGCGETTHGAAGEPHEHEPRSEHAHPRPHSHGHDHADTPSASHGRASSEEPRRVALEQEILARNNQLAARNRGWLEGRGIVALNLLGAPGAGKTSLLERTLGALTGEMSFAVIEGDQATSLDADRIRASGGPVLQVNTGSGCHLDARMVSEALRALSPEPGSVVLVENVGNLVCPALFDLGEAAKVVVLSVTEGEDKPLKYPHIFRASDVLVLNKLDLLPHLRFDPERCLELALRINPRLQVFRLSATSGEGLDAWLAWLREKRLETARALGSPLTTGLRIHN